MRCKAVASTNIFILFSIDSRDYTLPPLIMDFTKLKEPFPEQDIEWRIGQAGKSGDKIWATCFAYVTNRAIMERLDEVCSPENWKNEFEPWTIGTDHGVRCGVSIKRGGEWITKYDGASPTNMEPIKGGFSDSMKRAAVQWGIGRYLYDLESGFVKIVDKNTSGAKYGKLPNEKGGDTFYWIPPSLPGWALPNSINVPDKTSLAPDAKDKCSTGDVVRISSLCKETGTDLKKLYAHFKVGAVPTKDQAQAMIASLEKKLKDQLDTQAKND